MCTQKRRYNFDYNFDVKFFCLFFTAMTNRVNEWTAAYYSDYFNDFSLSCKLHQPCIYTSILIAVQFSHTIHYLIIICFTLTI